MTYFDTGNTLVLSGSEMSFDNTSFDFDSKFIDNRECNELVDLTSLIFFFKICEFLTKF